MDTCDSCRVAGASSTATLVKHPQIAPQSLRAALKEVGAPIPWAEGEDTFYGLADRPVADEHLGSRACSFQSCSSVRLEDAVQEQPVFMPALVEEAAVGLSGHAERATKASTDTKILAVNRTALNQLVTKFFQSSAFQILLKSAVHKWLAAPYAANNVATSSIYLPSSTVPVLKFVKNKAA